MEDNFDLIVVPAGVPPDEFSNMVHEGPVDEYRDADQFSIEVKDEPGVLDYDIYMVHQPEATPGSGN